jgi:MoxR-like ATPase
METHPKAASFEPELNLQQILTAAGEILLGKREAIRLGLTCLIAGGHLLIEDLPGVGKTTLAHLLARLLGLDYQRIQFTSDLLPADVIGVSIYDRDEARFHFHPGPVFAQLVLADEINRASPKTQSALLEAMEERQITVDAETHRLPQPFCVIATQNPAHQVGTFALPESQLDRFLMRISLGYPDRASERRLLAGRDRREMVEQIMPVADPGELLRAHQRLDRVHVADALLDYVQALLAESRRGDRFVQGLSPRAGLALLRAARAWAMIDGRYQVLPEDVQAVLVPVVAHRLRPAAGLEDGEQTAQRLLEAVDIP